MSYKFIFMLFFLYAIQGIPYGIQSRFLPIYLRSKSFSLTVLGLLKLLYIPWILKTFYAPIIDIFLTKIIWLKISVFLLFLTSIFFSIINCNSSLLLITGLFFFNLFSASQDISLDGIMISHLKDSELNLGNIAQVVGYKSGAIIGGGCLIILSYYFNWTSIFIFVSSIYFIGFLSIFSLKEIIISKPIGSVKTHFNFSFRGYWYIFKSAFQVQGTRELCILVLIYKLSEQGTMNLFPLFLFDKGVYVNQIGFWTGIIGQISSILGSSAAAVVINAKGLWRTLYILSIISVPFHFIFVMVIYTFTNTLLYFYFSVALVNGLLFISGIRTTTAFSLMMKVSQSAPTNIQSTHYTFLATIEVLGKLLFSTVIGIFADVFGYFCSYVFIFCICIMFLWTLRIFRKTIIAVESSLENTK